MRCAQYFVVRKYLKWKLQVAHHLPGCIFEHDPEMRDGSGDACMTGKANAGDAAAATADAA